MRTLGMCEQTETLPWVVLQLSIVKTSAFGQLPLMLITWFNHPRLCFGFSTILVAFPESGVTHHAEERNCLTHGFLFVVSYAKMWTSWFCFWAFSVLDAKTKTKHKELKLHGLHLPSNYAIGEIIGCKWSSVWVTVISLLS